MVSFSLSDSVGADLLQPADQPVDNAKNILRLSEASLRGIFDSSLSSFMLLDREATIQAFNKKADEIARWVWGRGLEKGLSVYQFVQSHDLDNFRENFHRALDGEAVTVEKNIRGKSDVDNWFEFSYIPVFDESQRVAGVCTAVTNIDARKKDALALTQSEVLFRTLVQNSSDLITVVDIDGVINYQSASVERILGYRATTVLGKSIFDFIHIDDKVIIKNTLDIVIKGADIKTLPPFRIKKANGEWIWVETIANNLLDETSIKGIILNSRNITANRQFEERLRLLEQAVEASSNGIVISDNTLPDNPVVYANPAFERLTGYNASEILGHNCRFLQGDDLEQDGIAKIRWAIREGQEVTALLRNYRKDGSLFWNELRMAPVRNNEGQIANFVGVQNDVTSRIVALEALQESEERYRTVAQTATDAIITIDDESEILFVNPATEKIFGYTLNELFGQPLTKLMPNYLGQIPEQSLNRYINEGQKRATWQATELRGLHKDGREIPLEISFGEFVRDNKSFFTGIIRDISERKEAQEALRRANDVLEQRVMERTRELNTSNNQLRAEIEQRQRIETELASRARQQATVAELGQVALAGSDSEALLELASHLVSRTLGLEFSAVMEYLPQEESFLVKTGIGWDKAALGQRKITAGRDSLSGYTILCHEPVIVENWQLETRFSSSFLNQKYGVVSSASVIIHTHERTPYGTLSVHSRQIRPFTRDDVYFLQAVANILAEAIERKRAEAEIHKALQKEQELGELKSRFVSMTSHEFRTPLTVILTATEMLEHYSERLSDLQKKAYLERIEHSVGHMLGMLNDILLIGKTEVGKYQLQKTELDVVQLCREVVTNLQLTNTNQIIEFKSHSERINAWLDEKLMRQVCTNLLSNALKYSPSKPRVWFELEETPDKQIAFKIRDEGIGIPLADQKHLFEVFQRASNTGKISGTGLGLTIVKSAVELHQGQIQVVSEVGVGTTFTVTIPLSSSVNFEFS